MNLYNNKLTRRTNKFLRTKFIIPHMRKSIKTDNWSLISNNCTSGFVYHDFGQQFRTPTINLSIPRESFFAFAKDLNYYLSKPVCDNGNDPVEGYPIGIIHGDAEHKDVIINFMHYKSFDAARKKWQERAARINFENIYIFCLFRHFMRLPKKSTKSLMVFRIRIN